MGIRTEPAINTSLLSSVQTKADKDTEQAVRQALEDNDIQTVFFVNLISRDQQESTSRNVNDSAYYLSTRVERTVFDATKEEKLPKDRSLESALSRSSYRARVFDFLMTTTPWLAFDATAGTSKDLEVNGDYHHDKPLYQNEVQSAVTASTYPDGVPTRLEYVSKQIAEVVSLTSNVEPAVKRFWVLVTSVSTSGTVARPLLRAYQFVFEKTIPDNEEESKLTFSFNLYATIFNENDFEAARESINSSLIDLGKALVRQKSTDIYLPALSSQT